MPLTHSRALQHPPRPLWRIAGAEISDALETAMTSSLGIPFEIDHWGFLQGLVSGQLWRLTL